MDEAIFEIAKENCPKAEHVALPVELPNIVILAVGSQEPIREIFVSPEVNGFTPGEINEGCAGAAVSRVQFDERDADVFPARSA